MAAALACLAVGSDPALAATPLALTEPAAQLERALECDGGPSGGRPVVILVHGTGSTPEESFSFGYARALPKLGFGVCTVRLPDRGLGDMQRAMQYVVHAVREVARRSGRSVSLVGHSQGAALAVYAPSFWPDIASKIDDVVGLGGPYRGTTSPDDSCADGRCPVFAWQFLTGSRLSAAYRAAALAAGPSFTAVATELDELVAPAPEAALLDGASNVVVQRLCEARPIEHYLLVGDAVAYAVALDALKHPGPADPARIPATRCLETIPPGADLVAAATIAPVAIIGALARTATAPDVSAEPRLRCPFDAADCPAPQLRLTRRCAAGGRLRAALQGDVERVRAVGFALGGRLVRRDAAAPFQITVQRSTLRRSRARRLRAVVELASAGRVVLARSLPRC